MPDILDDLVDLHKQATTERSHYYVAKTAERAIEEIKALRETVRIALVGINNISGRSITDMQIQQVVNDRVGLHRL